MLRATQYLPDIVWLQQCLYDAFHHRLDKKDAVTQTIGEFLEKLASGNHNNLHTLLNSSISYYPYFLQENARNEYRERIGSLQKAWALVGHMLKNHGKSCDIITVCYY